MKTLTEVFATNPKLLEEKEVKELVEEFRKQFNTIKEKNMKYWDSITTLTTDSELFVIKGISCKDVVSKIHDLSFNEFLS